MSKLILPQTDGNGDPYISYTQYSTWKKSKRDYIRQYFFGERFEGNAYTTFGSKVGEALEKNDFSGFTTKEQAFLKTIPRYDEFEKEIRLELNGFYVKGFIDTNKKDLTLLADYKTGDISKKTGDYESGDYNQVGIYAAAIQQECGVLPTTGQVILIGRKGNPFKNEELTLTGEYAVINQDISEELIQGILKDLQETAEEISEYYQTFLRVTGLTS